MNRRLWLVALVSLTLTASAAADEWQVGVGTSSTSGIGLSLTHWGEDVGFRFTGMAIGTDGFALAVIGADVLWSLADDRERFYTYLGGAAFLNGSSFFPSSAGTRNFGVGFGMETRQWDHLVSHVQGGYGLVVLSSGQFTSVLSVGVGLSYRTFTPGRPQ